MQPVKYLFRFLAINIRRLRIALSNRPSSDPSYKQQRLLEIGRRYNCSTFVETGTYLGDTVEIARNYFDQVLSIELSIELYEKNRERFKKRKNVFLWNGNSGQVMPEVLKHLKTGRSLFWLDAHYCGTGTAGQAKECPLLLELSSIATHPRKDHCILIDDINNDSDNPSVHQVREMLLKINPAFEISFEYNVMVALPPFLDTD